MRFCRRSTNTTRGRRGCSRSVQPLGGLGQRGDVDGYVGSGGTKCVVLPLLCCGTTRATRQMP